MEQREEFVKGKAFNLNGVEIEWAHLVTPDDAFGKKQWQITCKLNDKLAESLIDAGFNVKHTRDKPKFEDGDDLYYYIVPYTKCNTNKGKNKPPRVVDASKNLMDGSIVGNGSICNVRVFAKYTQASGQTFLTTYLNSVQVLELVEYASDGFEDESGGYDGGQPDGGVPDLGDDVPF